MRAELTLITGIGGRGRQVSRCSNCEMLIRLASCTGSYLSSSYSAWPIDSTQSLRADCQGDTTTYVMCLLVASRSWRGVHTLSIEMNEAEAQKGSRIRIQQSLITTAILLAACAPHSRDESATVESFYLSVSRGGGITGLVTGCDFNSTGRVREWRWTTTMAFRSALLTLAV